MVKVYLVRHGQTTYNKEHKLDGQEDTKLINQGIKQTKQLANYLSDVVFDVAYCSTLSRSSETLEILSQRCKIKKEIKLSEFKEIDCGLCTGLTKEEIAKKFPKLIEEWKLNTDPPFPEGESLEMVEKRAIPKFLEVISENNINNILIVGHGTLNVAIIGYLLGVVKHGLRFKIKQNNCCLNEIEIFDSGDFRINRINYYL